MAIPSPPARPSSLPLPTPRLRRSLEALSSRIEDPTTKLRFIRETLARWEGASPVARNTPCLRGLALHYSAAESLLDMRNETGSLPTRLQPTVFLYRIRYVILALLVAGTSFLGYQAIRLGYHGIRTGIGYVARLYSPVAPAAPAVKTRAIDGPSDYPAARQGSAPEEIWLVRADEEGELWSNGLRILTTYQTRTEERSYLVFPRDGSFRFQVASAPVGIVYHTSENDIAPFRSGFNREILRTTRGLLGWLRKRNLYNYFIDRFGQVYRFVIDTHAADHAGDSIWADASHLYINVSESFFGVCFESRWDPRSEGTEILTPAQIQAALNLTDMLRARYDISDTNCVPHGLVSVNPRKMLIGYHLDWAKGFPFAALGLTDKYQVPPPAMLDLGFGYDEHLIASLGGSLWPGIERAETEILKAAQEEGVPVAVVEKRLRERYHRQMEILEMALQDRHRAPEPAGSGSSLS